MPIPRFAKVVPLTRTRAGLESFDYALSETHTLAVGDVVPVVFRRQSIHGVIWELLEESSFSARLTRIETDEPLVRLGSTFVELVRWTAKRTFQPAPNILKAWLRELPKRIGKAVFPHLPPHPPQPSIQTHWIVQPQAKLAQLVRLSQKKRRLLIVPWRQQAEALHQELAGSHLLTGETATGAAFFTWTHFLQAEESTLITTKLGAWLSLFAEEVFCLEPENDDHKQEESSPRYDARLLLAWIAQHLHTPLTTVGLTPPLHVAAAAPHIDVDLQFVLRQPGGGSVIPLIQNEAIQLLEEHVGPRVIIHPIRGLSARLRCRECQWEALCPACRFSIRSTREGAFCDLCHRVVDAPLSCPSCGSVSLNGSLPGLDRLQTAWNTHFPSVDVDWRDARAESLLHLPQNALIFVTEPQTIGGFAEDVRRQERLCLAYRRLADAATQAKSRLLLQVREEAHAQWLHWLKPEGIEQLHREERAERRIFRYPPSVRLVKLLFSESLEETAKIAAEIKKTLSLAHDQRGPLTVSHRSAKQGERCVLHLLFPPETTEHMLVHALHPWAGKAVIDLDPTVFLR